MATTVANMLTWVGYRLDETIEASSEPSQSECIQWINEVCEELLTVCVTTGSEMARSAGVITTVDGTAAYTTWDDLTTVADTFFAPVVRYNENGESYSGWIEETTQRIPIKHADIGEWTDQNPSAEGKPTKFITNSFVPAINLFPTPDDEYEVQIPFYTYHTILTLTTETVPYFRVFDNVILESVVMRAQNRNEYDLSFELKWLSYIRSQAKKIIYLRRNQSTRIFV